MLKDEKPPTSKEEAAERRMRPPPERYDPDKLSHWSITMTVAWIIWRDLDAVRNQRDDYREKCADWKFERDSRARALADRLAIDKITGQIAPSDPDLQKKIQEKLKEHSWQLREWGRSGWNTLRASEHMRLQVAIDELWKAAGEGRIKAIALKCKNAKAFDGNQVNIPARHWAYLARDSDPSGKPILSGPDRVYREVRFLQLAVKKLWPKSPSLSGEPLESGAVEVLPEPERVAAPEPPKPASLHAQQVTKQESVPSDPIADVETREKDKGGRPPDYDWKTIQAFAVALVEEHGKPGKGNRRLPSKDQLVDAIVHKWALNGIGLAKSTVRRYVNKWLNEILS